MPAEKCALDCKEMEIVQGDIKILKDEIVRKSSVKYFIGLVVVLFGTFFLVGWNSSVKARDERTDNKASIKVFNVKMDVLIEANKEIKAAQKQVQQDLEKYQKELAKDRDAANREILKAIQELKK